MERVGRSPCPEMEHGFWAYWVNCANRFGLCNCWNGDCAPLVAALAKDATIETALTRFAA